VIVLTSPWKCLSPFMGLTRRLAQIVLLDHRSVRCDQIVSSGQQTQQHERVIKPHPSPLEGVLCPFECNRVEVSLELPLKPRRMASERSNMRISRDLGCYRPRNYGPPAKGSVKGCSSSNLVVNSHRPHAHEAYTWVPCFVHCDSNDHRKTGTLCLGANTGLMLYSRPSGMT
jgi:hypothetical protein